MSSIKLVTFNVNSIKPRLPIIETLIEEESPDVICFQETKCQDRDFPVDFFKTAGYAVNFRGMKSYNGVAVASKTEPESIIFGFEDGADSEQDCCRLATARFKGYSIVCTYVPQGKSIELPDFQYKLNFFKRLKAHFGTHFQTSDPLLWTGDINVAPTDIDVTHPENKRNHVCFTQEIKDALTDVLSWGFSDAYRKHRPDEGEFSFWDYRVPKALDRNIGWRIDHLFTTKPLTDASRDAYAKRNLRAMERPSDHTAVVGVFDI